mgnify:CR=1 FL=1
MEENTGVGIESQESVQDDAAQAPESMEIDASDLFETVEGEQPQEAAPEQQEDTVPKSLKGRLDRENRKGYDRGFAEAKAQWEAERAKMQGELEEYRELKLKQEAAELAKAEGISEAIALRLLRAERNMPNTAQASVRAEQQQKAEQPRGADGRFVSATEKAIQDRASMLMEQARNISRAGGPDVYEMYKTNAEIQRRLSENPDMDFYDVMREYGKKSMPPVTKGSTGGTVKSRGFADMSDSEMDQLNEKLANGYVVNLRR